MIRENSLLSPQLDFDAHSGRPNMHLLTGRHELKIVMMCGADGSRRFRGRQRPDDRYR